jgi:hypothetical protein
MHRRRLATEHTEAGHEAEEDADASEDDASEAASN